MTTIKNKLYIVGVGALSFAVPAACDSVSDGGAAGGSGAGAASASSSSSLQSASTSSMSSSWSAGGSGGTATSGSGGSAGSGAGGSGGTGGMTSAGGSGGAMGPCKNPATDCNAPPACRKAICNTSGDCDTAEDDTNVSKAADECHVDGTCSMGQATPPGNATQGTPCSFNKGSLCDGAGDCVECNVDADCGGKSCCANKCVDLVNDPANCGACGHDCLGSTCAASACLPTQIAVTTDKDITSIAADATDYLAGGMVYWTYYGSGTASKDGALYGTLKNAVSSTPSIDVMLASGDPIDNPYSARWDGGLVYFVEHSPFNAQNSQFAWVRLQGDGSGATESETMNPPTHPWAIALDAKYAFVADDNFQIEKFDKLTGSEIAPFPKDVGVGSEPIGVDVLVDGSGNATRVYWSDANGDVSWLDPATGDVGASGIVSFTNNHSPHISVSSISKQICATDPQGNKVLITDQDGNVARTFVSEGTPYAVAFDPVEGSTCYWIDSSDKKVKSGNAQGVEKTVATTSGNGQTVAVDAKFVFFDDGNGAIYRVAR